MADTQVHIEYMPLSKLKGNVFNPKEHDLGELERSIQRFGFKSPMILDERTNQLVVGHGRRDALIQLKAWGKEPPDGIVVDYANNEWLVPVIRGLSFANDAEAMAYIVADNRLTELGGWDEPALAKAMSELAAMGDEFLVGTGFDLEDVDELLKSLNKEPAKEEKEEEETADVDDYTNIAAELLTKWGVQDGDIWQIDNHFICCNDCRDVFAWRALLQTAGIETVNGVITSPPYAMQRKDSYGGTTPDKYVEWFADVQQRIRTHLAPDGSFFLNIKPHSDAGERVLYVFDLVLAMKRQWDWKYIDEFCWSRTVAPGTWPNRFKNGFEPVYHFAIDTKIKFNRDNVVDKTKPGSHEDKRGIGSANVGKYYNNVKFDWEGALPSNSIGNFGNAAGVGHTASWPVGLPEFFIKAFSDEGDVWLDPFAGAGTALLAAALNNRIGLGIEQRPEYVAVTIQRLADELAVVPKRV